MKEIKVQLMKLAEPEYQKFSASLLPGIQNILGVRLPALRKIAKQLAKKDWYIYLNDLQEEYFEEVMLHGMILGYVSIKNQQDAEELLTYIKKFIPKINNWSVCDSFCTGLKFTKEYKNMVWKFLQEYFQSDKEFEVRFAVVMSLNYYIEVDYLELLFQLYNEIKQEEYYVKMAVAWAVSMIFVKYPDETMEYLKNNNLDDETYHKALQKICESLKVDKETKQLIKRMK